jgi:hypothetical protein
MSVAQFNQSVAIGQGLNVGEPNGLIVLDGASSPVITATPSEFTTRVVDVNITASDELTLTGATSVSVGTQNGSVSIAQNGNINITAGNGGSGTITLSGTVVGITVPDVIDQEIVSKVPNTVASAINGVALPCAALINISCQGALVGNPPGELMFMEPTTLKLESLDLSVAVTGRANDNFSCYLLNSDNQVVLTSNTTLSGEEELIDVVQVPIDANTTSLYCLFSPGRVTTPGNPTPSPDFIVRVITLTNSTINVDAKTVPGTTSNGTVSSVSSITYGTFTVLNPNPTTGPTILIAARTNTASIIIPVIISTTNVGTWSVNNSFPIADTAEIGTIRALSTDNRLAMAGQSTGGLYFISVINTTSAEVIGTQPTNRMSVLTVSGNYISAVSSGMGGSVYWGQFTETTVIWASTAILTTSTSSLLSTGVILSVVVDPTTTPPTSTPTLFISYRAVDGQTPESWYVNRATVTVTTVGAETTAAISLGSAVQVPALVSGDEINSGKLFYRTAPFAGFVFGIAINAGFGSMATPFGFFQNFSFTNEVFSMSSITTFTSSTPLTYTYSPNCQSANLVTARRVGNVVPINPSYLSQLAGYFRETIVFSHSQDGNQDRLSIAYSKNISGLAGPANIIVSGIASGASLS